MWNLQAENLAYEYHYFFDNCTTRVRDYLDEALGGAISDQYSGVTEKTFRHYVREHYASVSLIGFSLDVLFNSNVDQQVSEWEDMFLPLTLRQRLQAMSSDVGGAEEVHRYCQTIRRSWNSTTYRSTECISDCICGIAGATAGSAADAEAATDDLSCDAFAHQSQGRRTELPLAGACGRGDSFIQWYLVF